MHAWSRSRAAAAITALALAAATAGCGSSTAPGPTGSTTTSAAPCPSLGSTAAASGAAALTRSPAVALLSNVQVQASACVDEVSFLFIGGIPDWSVAYRDGPLVEDPSGRPAPVGGAAHLVVRFQPAAGADLAQDHPAVTYDGPTTMRPPAPSGVAELRRLGDFESVMSWAIGLAGRRPFEAAVRPDQLVIRLAAAAPRPTRCRLAGMSVGYPADWYAELSDRWACSYFDPAPFVVHPATNDFRWTVTVQEADVPAAEVLARMSGPGGTVASHPARVAGLPATVLDVTASGQGLLPAGWVSRTYVVDTGSKAMTISGAAAPPGPRAEADRAATDRIAELLRPA